MKNINLIKIAACLIFICAIIYADDSKADFINIHHQLDTSNNEIVITISINQSPNDIYSFAFTVDYDQQFMIYNNNYERGLLLNSGFLNFEVSNPSPGRLIVGGFEEKNQNIHKNETGELVRLFFKISECSSGNISLINLKDDIDTWAEITKRIICNQSIGSISGRIITDITGQISPIIGAKIVLSSTQTSYTNSIKTDINGDYFFQNIPSGCYRLDINANHFTNLLVENITVENLQENIIQPIKLKGDNQCEIILYDYNYDNKFGLKDLIVGMKLLSDIIIK